MFVYSLAKDDPEAGIVKEAPKNFSERVILGIRPCDAKAFQIDDANFDTPAFPGPLVDAKKTHNNPRRAGLQQTLRQLLLYLRRDRPVR